MRHHQRSQLIAQYFSQAEHQKQQAVLQNLDDPFQTYYYPSPIEDHHLLHKLEESVKEKLVQFADMDRLCIIEEEMKKEMYCLGEEIETVRAGNEELNGLINLYESNLKMKESREQLRSMKKVEGKETANYGCQTKEIKSIQIGTNYETFIQEKPRKKQLFPVSTYSMLITTKQPQRPKEQIKAQPRKTQAFAAFPPSIADTKLSSIYTQVQKQVRYLEHLKKTKHKNINQYRDQKNKVKFMMELFWKNANSIQNEDKFNLPLIDQSAAPQF